MSIKSIAEKKTEGRVDPRMITGNEQEHIAPKSKKFPTVRTTPELFQLVQETTRQDNIKYSALVSLLLNWYITLPRSERVKLMMQAMERGSK